MTYPEIEETPFMFTRREPLSGVNWTLKSDAVNKPSVWQGLRDVEVIIRSEAANGRSLRKVAARSHRGLESENGRIAKY